MRRGMTGHPYVYGEPWTQTVVDQWGGSQPCSIARSPKRDSVVSVDNRGTAGAERNAVEKGHLQGDW